MINAVNPVLVEVTRGDMVESCHRGAAAVVDVDGQTIASWGDVEVPVYARSAIKPLQAIPLIETGAARALAVTDEEVALACASHSGQSMHVERVRRWLTRIGLGEQHLACGTHAPRQSDALAALIRAGASPGPAHNNCSGKHAGFLTTARHLGEATQDYIGVTHPVQRRVRKVLAAMSGADLAAAPAGIDGCGIPVIGMGLRATALAMARLGMPRTLGPARAAAAHRIVASMRRYPELVAGTGQFCTVIMQNTEQSVVVKTGAEGVFTAALPARGWGIALKIDDGASRAAQIAMAALLRFTKSVTEPLPPAFAARWHRENKNVNGLPVGVMRPARGWPES